MLTVITCADCGAAWTVERNGGPTPKRCAECARKRRNRQQAQRNRPPDETAHYRCLG